MRAFWLLAFAPLTLAACGEAPDTDQPRTIMARGIGEVTAAPDQASLRFAVESRAETAAAAMDTNAEAMTAVRDALRSVGVDRRDMQTSGFSLLPLYENESERRSQGRDYPAIVGYEASNGLMVRLTEVEKTGEAIDAAIRAGANRLEDLAFGFEDSTALEDEAETLAIEDARATAKRMAEAAGVRLGEVMSVSLSGSPRPQPAMMMEMRAMQSTSTPIEAGESQLSASATITYRLR
ncbi:outer membrane protein, 28Kda [Parvularcula bermudensis HTCC2503]|uniref:Outer membrane protein, 28Kda n=1 Tax=Parvularcula bermudensis (strain ATCC BAA-594 / HTCC2503 / KCTC 12087) TaxID=314260 RepID=E0TBT9_PARBH|nr:SIMPL domain-containing protein [Parvularcula bermudensis]ADM08432.1 outer membrane protein, 28Kda [Parvularcula bermudensis HTCC2503]